MDLSVVLVHYHTPQLAADAVAALRDDIQTAAITVEIIVVDNGSTAPEGEVLRSLDAVVLTTGSNLGYAGGVNYGVARSTGSDVIVMNADVLVQRGCLAALRQELRGGAAAAGPRFYWDSHGRILLPPTERRDLASEALARLHGRGPAWARVARQRWRQHARRHWTTTTSLDSTALSGALLAFRREVWNAVGSFDEGFRMYFEETEWLSRLAQRGWPSRYVPDARARHLYNRSAHLEADAAAWFADSARRFEELQFGRRAARWLRRLEPRRAPAPEAEPHSLAAAVDVMVPASPTWVEISPTSAGYPAAGERLAERHGPWSLPAEIWEHLSPGWYTLRLVSDNGRELSESRVRR